MSTSRQQDVPNAGDALIDEVRRIRREVCNQFGNDVDRLCDHLLEVQQDYAARRGPFSVVTKEAAAAVAASWGEHAVHREEQPKSGKPVTGSNRTKPD
jgi:hypothetical protein